MSSAGRRTPPQRATLQEIARSENGDVRKDIRPPLAPHRLRRKGVRPRLLYGKNRADGWEPTPAHNEVVARAHQP